jgi:hypothetical protein
MVVQDSRSANTTPPSHVTKESERKHQNNCGGQEFSLSVRAVEFLSEASRKF